MKSFFEELQNHGCISGLISELIYYCDTKDFYKTHIQEINDMLTKTMESCGIYNPKALFNNRNDADPLAQDNINQNLLARYAFEETMHHISHELGFDL